MPTSSASRASPKRKPTRTPATGKFCQIINGQRGRKEAIIKLPLSCILDRSDNSHWNC